jgi:hypothetical protein
MRGQAAATVKRLQKEIEGIGNEMGIKIRTNSDTCSMIASLS